MKNRYFFNSNCIEHFSLQTGDYYHIIHFLYLSGHFFLLNVEKFKKTSYSATLSLKSRTIVLMAVMQHITFDRSTSTSCSFKKRYFM